MADFRPLQLSLDDPTPDDPPQPLFAVAVYGAIAPQGSKNAFRNHTTGKIVMRESSTKVKPWREAVRNDAVTARAGAPTLDEPLVLDAVFTVQRPKNHYRTGRNAHLLRDDAPVRPVAKNAPGDLSKLVRAIEDSLTDAGVIRDDCLIIEYGRVAKVWVNGDRDALDAPGAVLRLWRLGEQP